MERTLYVEQSDTDPVGYLIGLSNVADDALAELRDAITRQDTAVIRAACLRLTSIGALAGIVGAKL
jgi:hypothetical protein